jgi:hypothetical protein
LANISEQHAEDVYHEESELEAEKNENAATLLKSVLDTVSNDSAIDYDKDGNQGCHSEMRL